MFLLKNLANDKRNHKNKIKGKVDKFIETATNGNWCKQTINTQKELKTNDHVQGITSQRRR